MTELLKIIFIAGMVLFVSACASNKIEIQDKSQQTTQKTYSKKEVTDVVGDFFAKGAEGVGTAIEKVFSKLGRPNAYITGSEGAAALVVGLRFGEGDLSHKLEGTQKVYWVGPSIGIDTGVTASKVFILVYNLYDLNDLYQRFPGGEGNAYLIGGISINYQQRKDIILVPIRIGVGVRFGINAGWTKYRKEKTMSPF